MENISLSDPARISNEQQHATSELFGTINTDVTKTSFTNPVDSPFKSLFPASTQPSSNASSQLFQQKTNTIPPLNPLLQFPLSTSSFSSPLIQPIIPPPSFPSVFTPNNQQVLIQPQLNTGNQQIPTQSVRFPPPNISTNVETTSGPPPVIRSPPSAVTSQDVQHNSQLPQSVLPPPPPPQQASSSATAANPYSARTALSERIYPSMPTTQMPSAHFQQQTIQPQLPPPSNHFVPTMPPTNTYSGPDTNIYNQTYQPPSNYNPTTPWSNDLSITYNQQQNDQPLANPSGIWGWLNNNKMLATVVEKAKVCH